MARSPVTARARLTSRLRDASASIVDGPTAQDCPLTPGEQHILASFFAHPLWPRVRPMLEQVLGASAEPLEAVVRKVRREQWGDYS